MEKTVLCVGGGAASFFAALHAKERRSDLRVIILEATGRVLTKVRISGGGRCNVTHNLFDLKKFASCYPRGSKELLGPLHRFGPEETIAWFKQRGVDLKSESDGRMFPTTDKSSTILECLQNEADALGVEVRTGALVKDIRRREGAGFTVKTKDGEIECDVLFLGTGSMPAGHAFAKALGHTITDLAPSLFTFRIDDPLINGLSGLSCGNVTVKLTTPSKRVFQQAGPLLVTHWGLSGPAILKLSAFAARELKDCDYYAQLEINFLPALSQQELVEQLSRCRKEHAKKQVANINPFPIPARFWKRIVELIGCDTSWAHLKQDQLEAVVSRLRRARLDISGKGEFKDEFVTCGGVKLSEVNFKTMQSKLVPGLYFAGEILDVDGITGGFNFQNAWTGGYIAGASMAD